MEYVIEVHQEENGMVSVETVKDGETNYKHMTRKFWDMLLKQNGTPDKANEKYAEMCRTEVEYF